MFNLATQLIIYLKCKRRDYQDIVQYRRNGRSRRPFFHKSRCGLTETVHCFLFHVLNAHSSGIYCKSAPFSSVFISPDGGSSCDPIKTSSAAYVVNIQLYSAQLQKCIYTLRETCCATNGQVSQPHDLGRNA